MSQILVITGGESWMDESVQPNWLTCSALDAISIHAYGTGDYATSSIQTYVQRAQAAGKRLLMEEWSVLPKEFLTLQVHHILDL